ncbi:MAG TPA: universal stress protein [Streptosporangiaceae bacterium]|nr:universal stress protein [Streptosporangiaceae bacterium]
MAQLTPRRQSRIVVGVDGSAASKAALEWAIRQGARTGSVVEVVTAYYWFPMPIEDVDFKGLATHLVEDAIFEAPDPGSPVKIVSKVVHGSPAKVLLHEAAEAELLVVGSRGHGNIAGALLGSVSHHCVHHAPCPVVVVRDLGARAHSGPSLHQGEPRPA